MNKKQSITIGTRLSAWLRFRGRRNTDELAKRNDDFTMRCLDYEQKIKELEKAAKEREAFFSDVQRIRAEHHMAEQIQRGMLPQIDQTLNQRYGIDLYADMDTAWEIGGDYYDFFPLDENRLFFCIADVSGKSVSAAMFSMVVKTFIKAALLNGDSLEHACYQASRQLYHCQTGDVKMFVTLWAGILNKETRTIEYINAGHEPPVIIREDRTYAFCEKVSGLPIAAYFNPRRPEKSEYHSSDLQLNPGDTLLLYTDGVSECANKEGARFGRECLANLSTISAGVDNSMRNLVCYIQRHVITHANHAEQDDDITVLALRILE